MSQNGRFALLSLGLLVLSIGPGKAGVTGMITVQDNVAAEVYHVFDTTYTCYNRQYALRLLTFADRDDDTKNNVVFTINEVTAAGIKPLLEDSLYSFISTIEFRDFNGDQVDDILVQHASDVRSNHTSYLYLADTARGGFKRIKGFETIKQPRYIPEYDLVDNYVVSGNNWTSFYKIVGDTIKDYGIILYEGASPGEQAQYDKDYAKALKIIMRRNKTR